MINQEKQNRKLNKQENKIYMINNKSKRITKYFG